MAAPLSSKALQYLFHHVFLPPRLPQSDDSSISMDIELLEQCRSALEEFGLLQPFNSRHQWSKLAKMVERTVEATSGTDHLLKGKLNAQFQSMEVDDVLAFHIGSQNSGLIIRRLSNSYSFESFELSATNESVMSTAGRLLRSFPGPAITVGSDEFMDSSFREEITSLLEKLSSETPPESKPISKKASSKHVEIRDTVHPKFVTEFLMGILRAIGDPHDPKRVYKHTRDEVLWNDTLSPWRRSPLWLLIRVSLHTTLVTYHNQEGYKSFMIYFLARILNQAIVLPSSSYILYTMMSKISRRAIKFELKERSSWSGYVYQVIASAGQCLRDRWETAELEVDPQGNIQQWNPSSLSIHADSVHSLRTLGPYLDAINNRATTNFVTGSFTPNSRARISLTSTELPTIENFSNSDLQETLISLQDFETWVRDLLPQWTRENIEAGQACISLSGIIKGYLAHAKEAYAVDPERTSLMLLTLIELWVALDRCAIHQYPLLRDYDPGFLVNIFEPLLLRFKTDMQRLFAVEQYIESRKKEASRRTGILTDFGSADSFGVRYFEQSPDLQELHRRIQAEANTERSNKTAEFTRVKQRYKDLIAEVDNMVCDEDEQWDRRRHRMISRHSLNCYKHSRKRTADDLSIDVHEWPLPPDSLMAKATVFEISIPPQFSAWRDTTFKLLVDVFSPPSRLKKGSNISSVRSCNTLQKFVRNTGDRIQIQSATKSFCVEHYKTKKAKDAATLSSICVAHGLQYSLYETQTSLLTDKFLGGCDVRDKCTLKLPPGIYGTLQDFISNTTRTSNEVLARQSECPIGLTLHEFYSFATLRSGHRLQARNIARELVSRTLNFNHPEVGILICQAMWQAGPADSFTGSRGASCDLEGAEFGLDLLITLEEILTSVEGNWQGANSVRTFIAIGSRLLTLSSDLKVQSRCLEFLSRCRRVTLEWVHVLREILQVEQSETNLANFRTRLLEVALICYGTFDVDAVYLEALLFIPENRSIAIECSIIIHDNCPQITNTLPDAVQSLLRRYQYLVYRLEPLLRYHILKDSTTIDNAIREIWSGYQPGMQWKTFQKPNERWVMSETSTDHGQRSLSVHFNILNGTLLVNGSPIARLPQEYESQDFYRRLFGERVLDVILSPMENMSYATSNQYCGYEVHFGMWNSKVIVRAVREGVIYEYIPSSALEGDFPQPLIENYTQWLKTGSEVVEWRPLMDTWKPTVEWQLELSERVGYILVRGSTRLIDITKSTAKSISQLLRPLEAANNILIELDTQSGQLKICLPRLKLDFSLRQDDPRLHSNQFRGMVMDKDQSLRSLTGLSSKFVLRGESSSDRLVVIPQGKVSFRPADHQCDVLIDTSSQKSVVYHVYDIITLLGQVKGKSLTGELYRAYLHAVTSNVMVDKLTGRTGTEEALAILKAASTRSFLTLESMDLEILQMISKLTPKREYYPAHLKSMQTVHWGKLSPLCQHPSFFKEVSALMVQAKRSQMFMEKPRPLPELESRGNMTLLERATIRESVFRVEGYGAEDHCSERDLFYESRDLVSNNLRERETCRVAGLVKRLSTQNNASRDLLADITSWGRSIHGLNTETTFQELGFSLKLLERANEIFPEIWLTIHNILENSDLRQDKYKIMIFLSSLAYSTEATANRALIETLLSIATHPSLRTLELPRDRLFDLRDQYGPTQTTIPHLRKLVEQHLRSFHNSCPEARLPPLELEPLDATVDRRKEQYRTQQQLEVNRLVQDFSGQWPNTVLAASVKSNSHIYINVIEAMHTAQALFDSWHRNCRLQSYAQDVTRILNEYRAETPSPEFASVPSVDPGMYATHTKRYFQFKNMVEAAHPDILHEPNTQLPCFVVSKSNLETDRSKIHNFLSELEIRHPDGHGKHYVENLMTSYRALSKTSSFELRDTVECIRSHLLDYKLHCKCRLEAMYRSMIEKLYGGSVFAVELANISGLLPRVSPGIMLSKISRSESDDINGIWYESIVAYGLALTAFQRAERLLSCGTNRNELLEELRNPGHTTWDPLRHADWLLLEIENNILIRHEQVQVANEMISPRLEKNSVMQLNMGLGKSSVIVPMVAASLADGMKLVNVVVLKSLSTQMFQLLVRKLGGLLNRKIFHTPLSRSLQLKSHQVEALYDLYKECMRSGGVLLVQPEHLLSFTLMGYDQLLAGNLKLGALLMKTQQWLDDNSRDILDESDEILSVKFELIYTIGTQCSIDFSPDRWVIIQEVLALVLRFAHEVAELEPNSVEILDERPGKFSRLRILRKSASDKIIDLVADHICQSGYLTLEQRRVMKLYLTGAPTTERDCILIKETLLSPDAPDATKEHLLMKGLLAGGIINFAFGLKRWRVDYGLDLSRTVLAVPYRAKDNPSARAEFSHPDATIILTYLSYYYIGLSNDEVNASFERVFASDHAQEEYDLWVKDLPHMPAKFRQLTGVNLSDTGQCQEIIFPKLRFAKGLINFYLANIVFPKAMKEFPFKLSASGWDLARKRTYLTTGFSGTNDSRYVLPVSIEQCDQEEQRFTNALQLDCLLRPENTYEDILRSTGSDVIDADVLIRVALLAHPPVRVILDVGAQVLEKGSEELARLWLSKVAFDEAQAAIFVDTNEELVVLYRDDTKESLVTSSFAKQIDRCLIYLDEAHTRGTDLKMPEDYRAIVTLGPHLVKDRLVQACMRLRKLGKGQSVVFCAPLEVQLKILECSGKGHDESIDVEDVLKWSISETMLSTRRNFPLWATQGVRHLCHQATLQSHAARNANGELTLEAVEALRDDEAQTLEQRYGFNQRQKEEEILLKNTVDDSIQVFQPQLNLIREKYKEINKNSFQSSTLQEEQERELSPENEREAEVERPPCASPRTHRLHGDVKNLVLTGTITRNSRIFRPAFETLSITTAFRMLEPKGWPQKLLVTEDFTQTIVSRSGDSLDVFLRPVNWIISTKELEPILVIISPYEAQELIPLIRSQDAVQLHSYTPRTRSSMRSVEDLSFCVMPSLSRFRTIPSAVTELNIFAGQLYIRDYKQYIEICRLLGLCYQAPGEGAVVASDGFVSPTGRSNFDTLMAAQCKFSKSPVAFLRMLKSFRRKGMSIATSHMGKILNGGFLREEDFEVVV